MKLKGDLANQNQRWQEKIESRNVKLHDITWASVKRCFIEDDIKTHRGNLEYGIMIVGDGYVKHELTKFIKELDRFQIQLNKTFFNFRNLTKEIVSQRRLLPERIQQFDKFTAGESFVGEQCAICREDIEIGRNMMRLDCDGQHTFCQVCIVEWFENHKTCPICRHAF